MKSPKLPHTIHITVDKIAKSKMPALPAIALQQSQAEDPPEGDDESDDDSELAVNRLSGRSKSYKPCEDLMLTRAWVCVSADSRNGCYY